MSIFEAIILGIIEGLTEFLPVSSTGHLILTAELLGLEVTSFLTTFEVVIQLGAILAVVTLYWKKFLLDFNMNKKLIVALIPSLVVGGLFYPFIKTLFDKPGVVVASLFLGGIAILVIEYMVGKRKESDILVEDVDQVSMHQAFYIGLFQALAVVPGVSRAGATIMGGLILGFRRKAIVEFSFLLAVPTMIAASSKDLFESGGSFGSDDFTLLAVGFVTAYLVAMLAMKLFLQFVQTNTFKPFGWYRIVLAIMFFLFIL
jgi:undecaprenyl-diphosphatase